MLNVRNFINFKDRAGRSEFWFFTLFLVAIYSLIFFLEGGFGRAFFANIFLLLMLVPFSAVGVRRFHDVDKSGRFFVVALILLPIIVAAITLTFLSLVWVEPKMPIEIIFILIGIAALIFLFISFKLLTVLCRKGDDAMNNYGTRAASI